jgi:hypothetical protein
MEIGWRTSLKFLVTGDTVLSMTEKCHLNTLFQALCWVLERQQKMRMAYWFVGGLEAWRWGNLKTTTMQWYML